MRGGQATRWVVQNFEPNRGSAFRTDTCSRSRQTQDRKLLTEGAVVAGAHFWFKLSKRQIVAIILIALKAVKTILYKNFPRLQTRL
jgi:hypothetical protein